MPRYDCEEVPKLHSQVKKISVCQEAWGIFHIKDLNQSEIWNLCYLWVWQKRFCVKIDLSRPKRYVHIVLISERSFSFSLQFQNLFW